MALTKKSGIDDTLAIVKDATKFKVRIATLAKAEQAAAAAVERSTAKNRELLAELDVKTKAANAELKAAITRAKELDGQGSTALAEAQRVSGETGRREKKMARREARLDQDRAIFRRDKAALAKEREALTSLAARFKAAATAACNGII